MSNRPFEPKFITVLRERYSLPTFFKDLTAGIIVGIVALPLSIAFAIASGVKPEQGLYTAVIGGFLISLFSGSRVQIGGPTGAFIVIIYDIVQKYGYDGLAVATVMAGILLIIMGLARLGDVIKFIPYPVTVGFTSGIALIILTSQIRDLLGLETGAIPADFIHKLGVYAEHIATINPVAVGLGLLTIVIIIFWPKVTQRVPGSIIAIIATTLLVHWLNLPVETIGSRFGEVPNHLPMPRLPNVSREMLINLSSPALAIALLAGIESLLSAVVADGMTGRRHRSNMELVAQGIANIASPIWGGIPATGAIARTATNIRNGGQTPFAGIIHAITLLLILLFFGHFAELIPMATLAGILVIVAFHMSEWHLFAKLLRGSKSDITVLLITFLLTVFIDLTVAIEVGVVLAAFLFMRRMIDVTEVGYITQSLEEDDPNDPYALAKRQVPKDVEVFEINGPFFFGAADKFKDTIRHIERPPKILILRMRYVPTVDATGLRALEEVFYKTQKDGTILILSGINEQPLKLIRQTGLLERIGKENVQENIDKALNRAQDILKITDNGQ